ncbi:MAG TPA: c-type cytochrome [Vicinamibacterales bacterium]|nr:c-type cytochrome [Vicinamibacterales bacterium]
MSVPAVRLTFGGVVLSALVFAVACGSDSSTTAPSPTTPAGPTFSVQIQQQIFNSACIACHTDDGRTPSGGLNLKNASTSYPALVNAGSTGKSGAIRVIPGNPSGSYLIQKLEGAADIVGLRMPRNGPPYLTDAQVQLIRQWIQNGAPNN